MTSYYEKLRDPRWQKKRLEIMERDGFACLDCGSKDKTLNVHHGYYEKGIEPWEYPKESLHTLCEDCHRRVEANLLWIRKVLGISHVRKVDKVCFLLRAISECAGDTFKDSDEIFDDLIFTVRGWKLAGMEDIERNYREIVDQEDAQQKALKS